MANRVLEGGTKPLGGAKKPNETPRKNVQDEPKSPTKPVTSPGNRANEQPAVAITSPSRVEANVQDKPKSPAKPTSPAPAGKPPAQTQPAVAEANVRDKPKSPAKPTSPDPKPVKWAKSPAKNQPTVALKSPSHAEAKSLDKRPAVKSPPGVRRELEHQSPDKPKPAVVKLSELEVEANSSAKAKAGQSEHRSPSPEFLPDEAQPPDINGGRILFGSGLSPTKAPAKAAVARLEPPVDTELTDDEDDETVIQRAQHATIRPGGRTARGRGRRRKRH